MQRRARWFSCVIALSLTALSLACFDAPVQHSLEIFFNAGGSVEIHASTLIRAEPDETEPPRVRDRIEAARDAILHGEDLWSRAFRAMEPEREPFCYDTENGLLVGAWRLAIVDDPSSLEKLFAETPVRATVEREGNTMTLELVPSGANEATERQERWVAQKLESFSEAAMVAECSVFC